jgi:hypothetical protein
MRSEQALAAFGPPAAGDEAGLAPAGVAPADAAPAPRSRGGPAIEDFIRLGPLPCPAAPPAPQLLEGVVSRAGGSPLCECGGIAVPFRRAPSCLLEPGEGDRILVCRTEGGAYALAVLERSGSPAVIPLPEDSRIEGKRLSVAAETLRVAAGGASVRAGRLDVKAVLSRADFTFLTVKARELVRLAGNFLSRSRRHRAEAEEAMRLAAPDLRLDAAEALRARAGAVDLKAEGPAKLDGAAVQVG